MKENIVKLINSGNEDDIIIGMHLLGNYEWDEILEFFESNFKLLSKNGRDGRTRFLYPNCLVTTSFIYGDNSIYIGLTNIVIPAGRALTDRAGYGKIIIR